MPPPTTIPYASGALPGIGHIGSLAKDPVGFFEAQRARGPIVRARLGPRPAYIVNDPELVRHMLVAGHRDFDKGGAFYEPFIGLVGESLGTCRAERHRVRRPLLQPAFHHSRMPGYADRMRECVHHHIAAWSEREVIDPDEEMARLATGALSATMLRGTEGRRIAETFQRNFPVILSGLLSHVLLPPLSRVPLPANRRWQEAVASTYQAISELVEYRRSTAEDESDLMTMLLANSPPPGDPAEDRALHEEVFGFLIGGIETTGSMMAWALHVLATHPEEYRRIQEELEECLAGRDPRHEDIPRLRRMQRLLTEVLRLYPPIWLLSRTTVAPTVLGGHRLPAGVDVFYSPEALHRDPAVFDAPERFDPDRWTGERAGRRQREALIPFGAGARKCIGDNFAMTEGSIALAMVLQRWRVRTVPGTKVRPRIRLTQRPAGLRLRLEARSPDGR
ncbi:cytochrome P450 [Streptomyces sp. TP-A0874]|uniref:cytochrome P450 n=1 Tax=Streptomyces sp. TP-A0874 TaxID=549819 RepID=UPI0008538F59|nr:cytochrome P450 [Streptomyces sp. TP-A0874]